MQVVCRSLPELEYYLFLSIPSHAVEALDFQSKVTLGSTREGDEISLQTTSEVRTSLQLRLCFSCLFAKSSMSQGLQTVAHLAAIHHGIVHLDQKHRVVG